MKNKLLLLLVFSIIGTGVFAQTTVWNPASDGDGLWTTAANWTNNLPLPAAGKAVFNVPNAIECVVNAAVSANQIVQGDGNIGGTLRILNGGSITTGAVWSGIGYNNTATLIVESGGAFTFGQHAWIGMNAGGLATVDISGTVTVTGMTGIGWSGGTGYVTVHTGGVMNCLQFGNASIKNGSVLDIRGGTVVMTGDKTGDVNNYITSGGIVAYGGGGTLNVNFADGNTTITSNADVTAPTVLSTNPANLAVDVPAVPNIKIEFSEPMNKASVEGAVTINPDIANKAFTWSGNTVTITGDDMASLQAYSVTIGTSALDGNDIALASEYSFGFTTVDPNAPPVIVTTVPANNATGVEADLDVVINFSKTMNTSSVEGKVSSVPAIGNSAFAWSNGDKTLTISGDRLDWGSLYTLTIGAGALAADATALAADAVFSFTVKEQPLTTIVWAPAADGTSDSLWTSASNWSLGEVADGNYKVVFNLGGAVPASHLNTPVTINQLVMGDGGPGGDSLVIENGGSITTMAGWSGIGYNQNATLVVEAGGEMNFASHAWIPLNAGEALVEIYGIVNVGEMTGLGWIGGTGTVNIYEGGVMNCSQFNPIDGAASIKEGSVLNIEGGTLVITGTVSAMIEAYAAAGRITAFGGSGLLRILQADGKTTITAGMTANTDATLSAITVDDGAIALDPAFDAGVYSYSVVAPSGTAFVSVKSTTTDPFATKTGGGVVDLSTGSGTTSIVVTAEDGTTQLTYTVDVRLESSDATLSSITVDAGTLDPAFDAGTLAYTLSVPNGTSSVNVLGVPNSPYATVSGDGAIDVSSGSANVSIVVTAEDESSQTYAIEITVATSVADLSKLAINAFYLPVQDLIRIENASTVEMIKVIDITGKVVISAMTRNSETFEIGSNKLTNGLYVIQLKLSDNLLHSVKFVK